MTDPRNPDYSVVDDDVAGHVAESGRVQPPRDDDGGDVHGHAFSAKPETKANGDDDEDDVGGHLYARPEDQSREG